MPVVELLAHVSAPSSRAADARLRDWASAYEDFHAVNRIDIFETEGENKNTQSNDSQLEDATSTELEHIVRTGVQPSQPITPAPIRHFDGTAEAQHQLPVGTPSRANEPEIFPPQQQILPLWSPFADAQPKEVDYIDDSALAAAALESQLITSSLRALGAVEADEWEPRDVEEEVEPAHESEAEDIEGIEAAEQYQEQRNVLEQAVPALAASNAISPDQGNVTPERPKAIPHSSPAAAQTIVPPLHPTDQQPTIPIPESNGRQGRTAQQSPTPGPIPQPAPAVMSPDARKKQKITPAPSEAAQPVVPEAQVQPQPPSPPHTAQILATFQPSADPPATVGSSAFTISSTILPPPPPLSISTPTTFLTPDLQALLANPMLKNRYTPLTQTRPLRPTERGFWHIKPIVISSWAMDLRCAFWEVLVEQIGGGKCGWCVTVYAGGRWSASVSRPDHASGVGGDNVPTSSGVLGAADGAELELGLDDGEVRVYCFGEMVEAIYLLLYVASRSKIRGQALEWVDGGGEVVVRMG